MKELVAAAGATALSAWGIVYAVTRTGDANLDRLALRGRLALEVLKVFPVRGVTDLRLARALMSMVAQESGGKPANYVHDINARFGPGVGPLAVNRGTAKELRLWTPPAGADEATERQAYLALAQDEGRGLAWGVRVFAAKLTAAKGDLYDGIRRYNGSGPNAELYRDTVLARAKRWGWTL